MSAARRLSIVLALAVVTVALYSASASAQACPGNPSGGTSLRQTREEGTVPAPSTDFLPRGISLDTGLQGWFSTFVAARYPFAVASRSIPGRAVWAITQRKLGGR